MVCTNGGCARKILKGKCAYGKPMENEKFYLSGPEKLKKLNCRHCRCARLS
jgi:hypothetical protein